MFVDRLNAFVFYTPPPPPPKTVYWVRTIPLDSTIYGSVRGTGSRYGAVRNYCAVKAA
jgi:hypothetical protein